ncbi:MAG: hypothetical protein JXA41_11695 [Deltaproteobacteria bacterium]|nr:hypothetical protein [Deltaproteobacteria bacterium]
MPSHFVNPVTGEKVPEIIDPTRCWLGNWPGEFGQRGRTDTASAADESGEIKKAEILEITAAKTRRVVGQ